MINWIQESGMKNDQNTKIKLRKYPGAPSIDILDNIKPSVRKEPD